VIGALLIEGTAIAEAAAILQPEDFYTSWRSKVYGVMLAMHRAGLWLDQVTVRDRLRREGLWDKQLEARLAQDAAAVPSAAAVLDYARIVREHSVRREVLSVSREIQQAALRANESEEIASLFSRLKRLTVSPRSSSSPLVFRQVGELVEAAGDSVPWLCPGLLAEGHLTLLVAKPKGGKSTLAFALAAALEKGTTFLGQPTVASTAIYLSEEALATIHQKARRFGVSKARFLTRQDAYPRRPFSEIVRQAVEAAHRHKSRVLFVDTLTMWAGLPPDAEKDSGAMQAAADILLEAGATGLAVAVLHHARKAPGDESDMVRGSSALPAAADIIVTLTRRPGEDRNLRDLGVLGRDSGCPPQRVIRLGERGFELVGTDEEVKAMNLRDTVLDVLPEAPAEGLKLAEIRKETKGRKEFVHKILKDLGEEGLVEVTGEGRRGSPYRFRLPSSKSCSRSHPHRGGPGTESSVGLSEEVEDEETDSVPVPPIYGGPGTETGTASGSLPWLGFSSDLWGVWDSFWSRWQERAAVLEADGGLPREEAERRAWQEVAP
jgi:hypothetical protein